MQSELTALQKSNAEEVQGLQADIGKLRAFPAALQKSNAEEVQGLQAEIGQLQALVTL